MVGYVEYAKEYNLFDPSYQKIFIERSVQFEEEPMQEIELVKGECSHLPLHDDVSDDYLSNFSDYYVDDNDDKIHSYHDSPIRKNWDEWMSHYLNACNNHHHQYHNHKKERKYQFTSSWSGGFEHSP